MLSLPTQSTVMDGSGNIYARSSNTYDTHGNLLSTAACLSNTTPFTPPATCTSPATSYTYDAYGNVLTITDGRNNRTSIDYADSYSDGGNGRNTNGLPTKITNALSQSTLVKYDYDTGKATLVTDPNGVETAYYYNDSLERLTQVVHAQGTTAENQTKYQYSGATQVDISQGQKQDAALHTESLYDGLGRPAGSRQYDSSCSYGYIFTRSTYDALGRVATTTNPSCPGDGLNYSTIYKYDALGRTKNIQTADGAVAATAFSADGNYSYAAASDQAGHQRAYVYNGLGQLAGVVEDPSGLNYSTGYTYDPLNDLMKVTQGSQSRTFQYDSWARLTSASNPESGIVQLPMIVSSEKLLIEIRIPKGSNLLVIETLRFDASPR